MDTIASLIQTIGFPAAVAGFVLYRLERHMLKILLKLECLCTFTKTVADHAATQTKGD